jgi:3-methyl-2-oxobutanoate hydroxymethyltransferase
VYRDFDAEHVRLQQERIAAFGEFRADVIAGEYPAPEHLVPVADDVVASFVAEVDARLDARLAP